MSSLYVVLEQSFGRVDQMDSFIAITKEKTENKKISHDV